MFPNLAAGETCVAETNFAARKKKSFCHGVKNIFASRTQILRPKRMFPSLASPGNITRNIVSATMFPSLARPLVQFFDVFCRQGEISKFQVLTHNSKSLFRYI